MQSTISLLLVIGSTSPSWQAPSSVVGSRHSTVEALLGISALLALLHLLLSISAAVAVRRRSGQLSGAVTQAGFDGLSDAGLECSDQNRAGSATHIGNKKNDLKQSQHT